MTNIEASDDHSTRQNSSDNNKIQSGTATEMDDYISLSLQWTARLHFTEVKFLGLWKEAQIVISNDDIERHKMSLLHLAIYCNSPC